MLKKNLAGGCVALHMVFCAQAQAEPMIDINQDNVFPACQTLSGQQVRYSPLAKDDPLWLGSSVAFAHYDDEGAVIYYDAAIFDQLSVLAQMQIIAHECAHQYLGHTEHTKNSRETQMSVSPYVKQRKEKDADCEAIYYLKETHDISREDIADVFHEIYRVIAGPEQMDWGTYGRMVRAQECHDGFYKRPQAFSVNDLTP